jgi:hypothetical protein
MVVAIAIDTVGSAGVFDRAAVEPPVNEPSAARHPIIASRIA